MVYQQGDVLLMGINELPKELKKQGNGLLAEGEATGHAHKVNPVDLSGVDVFCDDKGNVFVDARKEFSVVHEEHKTITLPAGKYETRIVKEYDHFAEEARKVRD